MQTKLDAPDVFIPASIVVTVSCDSHSSWQEKMNEGMHIKDFIKKIEHRLATDAQRKPGGVVPILSHVQMVLS